MTIGFTLATELEELRHARRARVVGGADGTHQMWIVERTTAPDQDTESTSAATGGLPL